MLFNFFYSYNPDYIHHVAASGRCAVNVWGMITRQGLGPLVRMEERFTSRVYAAMIDDVMVPYSLEGPFPVG